MNRAGKIALGCLLFPVFLLLLMLVFALSARMAGVPESEPVSTELAQGLEVERVEPRAERPETRLETRGSQERGIPAFHGEFVRVRLELEEAEVEIVPGPADKGIQVAADYDEAVYDLRQEYGMDDDGHATYLLQLRPRIHWLRRLLAGGEKEMEETDNFVRVRLPVDTPMELSMKLSKASAEIDLTDIAVVAWTGRLNMGEYSLEVDTQNPIDMSTLNLECKMGEFELHGLARLAPREMVLVGNMGEMRVDLGGPLVRDTALVVRMTMGELSLRLPDNAMWDGDATAWLGEVTGDTENPELSDPEGPKLHYKARVSFGELDIDSYAASRGLGTRRD